LQVTSESMPQVDISIAAGIDQVGEPWLWTLSQDFHVRFNVKKATVNSEFGSMLIELDGPAEEIQRATAWLMTTGLRIEAMTRALGA
jgi:L-aspartate semialdehyde sulfurtransferase ferredoxin